MDSAAIKKGAVPVLLGAGACLFFQRSGFLSFFFLVPLGVVAFRNSYRIAWSALLLAVLGNLFLASGQAGVRGIPLAEAFWDSLYFAVMACVFMWIISPPPGLSRSISGGVRFMIGSCLASLFLMGVFFRSMSSPGFSAYVQSLMNQFVSLQRSAGADVVRNALLEEVTAEMVLDLVKAVMLRGGSLVTCVLIFFICFQISLVLARLFLAIKLSRDPAAGQETGSPTSSPGAGSFTAFHVYPPLIWVLSLSLLLVVLTRMIKLEIPEIILWNVLILCGILYLAQGMGILRFLLARPSMPPFLRFLLGVLFVAFIFSPVINVVLLAGVVLLGIAENWVPFRAPKSNGPSSTPEAGDDESRQ